MLESEGDRVFGECWRVREGERVFGESWRVRVIECLESV